MKRIIFMGTPDFAATVLEGLINDQSLQVVAVVTQPDRKVGRRQELTASPVKELALQYDIPVYQPEKISGSQESNELIALGADLIVTAAYGQFVPTKLLDAPLYGAINVHASLLPKYRGGAPIHYAIWQGEHETGISIIYMTKEMDAGDILAQRATPIHDTDDTGDLFIRLADIGRDLLLETIPEIFNDSIHPQSQNPDEVTFSPTIKRSQEQLDWNQSATEIDRHVRAFRPFPSTYTWLEGQRVKVWAGHPLDILDEDGHQPGTIIRIEPTHVVVLCGDNSYYAITEWQLEGKRRMTIESAYNGLDVETLVHQVFEVKSDE